MKTKQNTAKVYNSLDSMSMCPSGICMFTVLSVFKGLCHKAVLYLNVTL